MNFQLDWKNPTISPSIIDFNDIIAHLVCKDSIWTNATSNNALGYILAEFFVKITKMKKLRDSDFA